jgi:hypothetical protein
MNASARFLDILASAILGSGREHTCSRLFSVWQSHFLHGYGPFGSLLKLSVGPIASCSRSKRSGVKELFKAPSLEVYSIRRGAIFMHRKIGNFAIQLMRSLMGVVAGYAVMVFGTTIVQNDLLGGHVSYTHSPTSILLVGAVLTPLAALMGGFITGAIAGRAPFAHVVPMCTAIALETAYFTYVHRGSDPLWFRASAALALILGAFVGAWLWRAIAEMRAGTAYIGFDAFGSMLRKFQKRR